MKAFTPMQLVAETATENYHSSIIQTAKQESFIESFLEYRSSIRKAEYARTRGWYRSVLESGGNHFIINEGAWEGFKEWVKKVFEAIKNFFYNIFKKNTKVKTNIQNTQDKFDTYLKELAAKEKKNINEIKTTMASTEVEIIFADISKLDSLISKVLNIADYNANVSSKEELEELKKKLFAKIYGTTDTTIKQNKKVEIIKSMVDYKSTKIGFDKFIDFNADFTSKSITSELKKDNVLSNITKKVDFDKAEVLSAINNMDSNKEEHDKLTYKLTAIKLQCEEYCMFSSIIDGIINDVMNGILGNIFGSGKSSNKEEPTSESATMFGEPFDGDTIYTNGMDDFTPSDFMNVTLEGSHYLDRMLDDTYMYRYINECLLLAENRNNLAAEMTSLNEATDNKIKSIITRFINFIKSQWEKFIGMFKKKHKLSQAWLSANKDTILNKAPKDVKLKPVMKLDVALNRVRTATFPHFDYNTIKGSLDSKEDFIKYLKGKLPNGNEGVLAGVDPKESAKYFKMYFLNSTSLGELDKQMSAYLQYEDVTIASICSKISLKEMYDFCMNYSQFEGMINKFKTEYDNEAKRVQTWVDQASRNIPTAPQTSQTAAPQNAQGMIYSLVYNRYLTEAELADDKLPKNDEKDTKAYGDKEEDKTKAMDDMTSNKDKNNTDTYTELSKQINNWFTVSTDFFNERLNALNKIYEEFNSIMKYHVQSYGNNTTTDKNMPNTNVAGANNK